MSNSGKNVTFPQVQNVRYLRRALARVKSSTQDAKILCVGDSTTAGCGINGSTQGNPKAYPSQLASLLNAHGISSAPGLAIPAPSAAPDSRWTLGANWSLRALAWGLNGTYTWTGGVVNNLVFADTNITADRFDIYYLVNNSLGTVGITATGGTTVNQSCAGSGTIGKITVSAASASTSNTVTFVPANNGDIHIIGIEPWLSTANKVRVGNAGSAQTVASSSGWGNTTNSPFGPSDAIKAYAPDLTIISLTVNDAETNNGNISDVVGGISTVAQAASASGDVFIMSPIPMQKADAHKVYQDSYIPSISALPYTYIDLKNRWTDGDTMNSLGMMYDQYHPNAIGYADIAEFIKSIIVGI